jgi:Cu/Ag efflux protein CusF
MKKAAAILVVMVVVVSLVSLVFAAEMKGTIKKIDAKAGTVVFSADGGKDETLKADKTVLGTIKEGDKVEAVIEQGTLKSVKAAAAAAPAAKKKAAVGC